MLVPEQEQRHEQRGADAGGPNVRPPMEQHAIRLHGSVPPNNALGFPQGHKPRPN